MGALPEPELNYYEQLGRRMNRLKYALLSALTIFVIIGITFHSDKLNMDNFRYMLKFLSIDMDSEIEEGAQIEFDPAPGTKALTVNGDLAIADSNGLQVFDMSGERFLRERDFMNDAMCVKSGSNILLCDRGTQTINAYTVYARIYSYEAPYPVYDLCASAESGRYAVITAANGYRSGIEVYDTEFRKIFDYYFADRYVSCIALSYDGQTAAACTVNNSQNGDYCGEMYIYDVSDTANRIVREFPGEIPWRITFRQDGGYMLMTNRSLWLFDPQGNERGIRRRNDQGLLPDGRRDRAYVRHRGAFQRDDGALLRQFAQAAWQRKLFERRQPHGYFRFDGVYTYRGDAPRRGRPDR